MSSLPTLRIIRAVPPVSWQVPRLAPWPVAGLLRRARGWPVASQQGARRNAMVACTAAADRRAEREDVADFLTALETRRREAAAAHG